MSEQGAINKSIESIGWSNGGIRILFTDKSRLYISDNGQCCCEYRYMTCDNEDSFDYYTGATYLGYDFGDLDYKDDRYDIHEIQFLNIRTSKGVLVFASHNEHNGYYGGFSIDAHYSEDNNGS